MRCLTALPNSAARVISIALLILTLLQVSTSYIDMQPDRNERIALLRGEFDCSGPDGAVDEACIQAVKDARLLLWRASELGVNVKYPFEMKEDNAATVHCSTRCVHLFWHLAASALPGVC